CRLRWCAAFASSSAAGIGPRPRPRTAGWSTSADSEPRASRCSPIRAPSSMVRSGSALPLSEPTRAEVAIVGGGPVGLYAAYYAGFRGLTGIVFEALPIFGGQISAFYPEAVLYDVPGFPAITGRDLVERLREQAARFPFEIRLGEEVVAIEA